MDVDDATTDMRTAVERARLADTVRRVDMLEARLTARDAAIADAVGGQKGKELTAKFAEIDRLVADLYAA